MKETQSFSMTEFQVMQWSEAKGILKYGTPIGQAKKALAEAQELIDAIEAGDMAEAELELGDVMVCLVNTAVLLDLDARTCFYKAYKKIEHRKGHMNEHGQFVKEA
jgi:NTP pyrophosphatase (non-canonical NTP hydrolase)